jgi:prepilin-type N-terminal cleavage/methylation domain-containing protein
VVGINTAFLILGVKRKRYRRLVAARIKRLSAFTLVEIMIVVAIIGVLAAAVIPSMVKARKQSQGRRIINDARQLDAAINQWALEKNKSDGATINTTQAASYLKGSWPSTDLLGNAYRIRTVGTNQITISRRTKNSLAGVGIDWGSY